MTLSHVGLAVWLVVSLTSARPIDGTSSFQSRSTPAATIEETAWNAIELYGAAVSGDAALPERRPHLVFGAGGRLSGADGCNRLSGRYSVKGNALSFGQIASTRMACPAIDEVANRFQAALKGTSHWSFVKDRLELYGATGKALALFERRSAGGL